MSEPPRRKVKPPSTSTRPAPVAAEAAARSAEPASQKAGDSAAAPAADTIPATEAPTAGEPPAASVDAAPGEASPAAAAPAEPAGTPASRDDGAPSEQASNSLTAVRTFDAESNNAAADAATADNASAAPGEAPPAATAPAEPAGTPAEQASAMADGLSPEQASSSFPVVETFDTESSNAAAADAAPADREPAAVAATSVAAAAAESAAAPVAEAAPDASEFPVPATAEKAAPASKQEDAPAAPVRKVKGPKVKAPTGALTPATQSVVEDDTPWYGEWQEPDAASEPASQVALGVPVEKLKVDPTPVIPPPRKALKTSEAPRGRSPNRPPERAGIPASHKALAAVAALVVLCGLVFVRPGASQSKPLVKSPVHIVIAMDKKIKPDSRILYEFPEAEFKVQRSVKEIKSGKELVLQAEVEGKAAPTYCMVTFFHANKKSTGAKKIELTGTPLEGRYP